MTSRRGFLGILAASPLGAKQAMQEVSSVGEGSTSTLAEANISPVAADPITSAATRFLAKKRRIMGRRLRQHRDRSLPVHISEKKSWSACFKQHCLDQELDNLPIDYWDMTPQEILKEAIKWGFKA